MEANWSALEITAYATWLAAYLSNDQMKRLIMFLGQFDTALGTILVEREICEDMKEKLEKDKKDNDKENSDIKEDDKDDDESIILNNNEQTAIDSIIT